MPIPEVHFWTKNDPAKNTPSLRRPVRASDSSTTSAIIDAPRMNAETLHAVWLTINPNSSGTSKGEPTSGNAPASRNHYGIDRTTKLAATRNTAALGFIVRNQFRCARTDTTRQPQRDDA